MAVRIDRGRYVVEFQQGGSRIHRRLPSGTTRAQAAALETKIRRELFDFVALGRREELTLTAAIGLWLQANRRKNQRQAESEARQWEPFVRGRMLREAPEVAQEAVAKWNATAARRVSAMHAKSLECAATRRSFRRAPEKTSPATINRRLALLKAVCKHAWKAGLYPENLSGRISLLREDNKREVYLTRAQVAQLAKCAPSTMTRYAILLAAFTGLRASEILALGPETLRSGSIFVATSKNGQSRYVPLPPTARQLVRALPLGLSYWQLHKEFSAARKAAGMPHVQFHDLRHTCASWLINEGVDLYTVGKILGHTTPATTARYAHLSTATLERAMRKLK